MLYKVFFAFLCLVVTPQSLKLEPYSQDKSLLTGYDRFRDESVLATKPETVAVRTEKGTLLDPGRGTYYANLVAAIVYSGRMLPAKPDAVAIIIAPVSGGFAGRLQNGARRLYFPPDSDLIAIVDGDRLQPIRGEKPGGLLATGDYNDAICFRVPLSDFEKISKANRVEMAIGSAEINFKSSLIKKAMALDQAITRAKTQ